MNSRNEWKALMSWHLGQAAAVLFSPILLAACCHVPCERNCSDVPRAGFIRNALSHKLTADYVRARHIDLKSATPDSLVGDLVRVGHAWDEYHFALKEGRITGIEQPDDFWPSIYLTSMMGTTVVPALRDAIERHRGQPQTQKYLLSALAETQAPEAGAVFAALAAARDTSGQRCLQGNVSTFGLVAFAGYALTRNTAEPISVCRDILAEPMDNRESVKLHRVAASVLFMWEPREACQWYWRVLSDTSIAEKFPEEWTTVSSDFAYMLQVPEEQYWRAGHVVPLADTATPKSEETTAKCSAQALMVFWRQWHEEKWPHADIEGLAVARRQTMHDSVMKERSRTLDPP